VVGPDNEYMGTTMMVPIKTSRDREFSEDLWGDFAETRRVNRGHRELQNIPQLFSDPMPFEGATNQILTKNWRGRPGKTNIWAPHVPIKDTSRDH
jgi:hypothetical protein